MFQRYRNRLIHLNLPLEESDLFDLKYEFIYIIVHVIVTILTEIDYMSSSDFYEKHLNNDDYKKLIKYKPYVEEMKLVAMKHSNFVYKCPKCNEKSFATDKEICYCCNLQLNGAIECIDCNSCNSPNCIIFDYLNIEINDNIINGLCLNCDETINIFKCPICNSILQFHNNEELENNSCFPKCKMHK